MNPYQLLIKPAAGDCNLRCSYCFYRETTPELYPEQTKHRMSLETMEAVVKDFMSHRFSETVFCWQGGEPTLMGLDFFQAVVEAQIKHGADGQVVGNAFQTNGVLIDDDWARFLARYHLVVGLSLDGPRDLHDQFRQNHAGRGSFDQVMAAAEKFRSFGVTFNILAVVNRDTQERGREIYRFFRAHGFDHLQFIPCLERDPETGEVLPFCATPDGLGRFFADVFDEYRRDGFPQVSERTFDALLNLHLTGDSGLCTFGPRCGGYLVIEHNGDVYPCDFFVRKQWRLGNVAEGPLARFFDHPLMKNFQKAKARRPPECAKCKWLTWCHGGCLKDRLPRQADGPGKTYFCESYRRLHEVTGADVRHWAGQIKLAHRPTPAGRPGRNDPCPCGSGKKFKRCCGAGG